MLKIITAVVAAPLIFLPLASHAQFNLPNIPKLGGALGGALGGSSGGSDAAAGQSTSLVRGYVAANKDVLNANSLMAEALGLKDEAASLKATANALTEGATQGNLEESNKAVSTSTDKVAAAMAKHPQMDAASKAKYQSGMGMLGTGMLKYIALRGPAADFSSSIRTVSPTALTSIQSGIFVMTKLPSSISNLNTSLKNATAFSKSNDIPVPDDATKALAAI